MHAHVGVLDSSGLISTRQVYISVSVAAAGAAPSIHRAMCRGSRYNGLAVTVPCHVVSPLPPLLLAGKYRLKGHSTLGVSASAEPFCTAVSGPAACRRSLCSQGSAAAPRRQLFLAQVAKMCMSYACNRFCQQMQQAMA